MKIQALSFLLVTASVLATKDAKTAIHSRLEYSGDSSVKLKPLYDLARRHTGDLDNNSQRKQSIISFSDEVVTKATLNIPTDARADQIHPSYLNGRTMPEGSAATTINSKKTSVLSNLDYKDTNTSRRKCRITKDQNIGASKEDPLLLKHVKRNLHRPLYDLSGIAGSLQPSLRRSTPEAATWSAISNLQYRNSEGDDDAGKTVDLDRRSLVNIQIVTQNTNAQRIGDNTYRVVVPNETQVKKQRYQQHQHQHQQRQQRQQHQHQQRHVKSAKGSRRSKEKREKNSKHRASKTSAKQSRQSQHSKHKNQ